MNYRLRFLANLLTELAEQLSLSAQRDLDYIQSRFEHEGISFLTITLPTFSDGLESSLENGFATPARFPAFARNRSGCLPKFLSGFTRLVFDDDGHVKADADPDAIYAIRQISRYYKKATIVCSDERIKAAELQYISTDLELSYHETKFASFSSSSLRDVFRIVSSTLEREYRPNTLVPRHGPGATAEFLSRNSRERIRQWPIRAEPYFPLSRYAIPNSGWLITKQGIHYNESISSQYDGFTLPDEREGKAVRTMFGSASPWKVAYLSEGQEPPVRVVFVPKTLKAPRVIAVEPSHMQYMQQAVLQWLVPVIERNSLFKQSVHFTDQAINRESARASSISKQYATIDLSEASDRVSWTLVQEMLSHAPTLLGSIAACRSREAKTPNGSLIKLSKFASMGSALCFPIEALVFYCLIQSAIHKHVGVHPTRQSIESFSRYIHVYGDDIIVPVVWLASVIKELEGFGLKVNSSKSFSRSHFRESCGGDYYNGYDVKPSYFRIDPSRLDKRLSTNELVSLVSHSNQLYLKGLWTSAQYLRDFVESKLKTRLPVRSDFIQETLQDIVPKERALCFFSVRRNTYNAWNRRFCRAVSRAPVLKPVRVEDRITADPIALTMKSLRNIGNDIPCDFVSSVRARTLRHKMRWLD